MNKLTHVIFILMAWIGFEGCTSYPRQTRFFVGGDCPVCEELIESAAQGVRGVDSAGWDMDSKILTIRFDSAAVTEIGVQEAIAQAGFATTFFAADSQAKSQLPTCCQTTKQIVPPEAGLPTGH